MRIDIERGLDLALPGEPAQAIGAAVPVGSVALVGPDYAHLKPALEVAPGQAVRLGQTLFTDRAMPTVRYTSPATGIVSAVHRGAKRRLLSVVIEVEGDNGDVVAEAVPAGKIAGLERETVVERLLEAGLWTSLRGRPFDAIADPALVPRALVVCALDTRPHAPDPAVVLAAGAEDAWRHGLNVLSRLATRLFVCVRPGAAVPVEAGTGVTRVEVSGPHPAGLPGTLIDRLCGIEERPDVWHVGYQDVVAIGRLFAEGRLATERIVALGGPGARRPRLLETRLGACLGDLLRGEQHGDAHVLAGSALDGRACAAPLNYLGRYDTQIALLGAAPAQNGVPSGMLNVEAFERVWPFAVPPLPLLRALLSDDLATARRLGGLGLVDDDLALCTYVCPAKQDYGHALAAALEKWHAEL